MNGKFSKTFVVLAFVATSLWACRDETPVVEKETPAPTSPAQPQAVETGAAPADTPEASGSAAPPQPVDNSSPVVVLMEDSVTTLDPYFMVTIHPDESISSHIWDTLTRLDQNLQVQPLLAESWHIVNNFTWEFKLRQDVTFHNGEILNAEAVRYSIERARSLPDSTETFATDVGLDKVDLVDNYTIQLTTRRPVANLPYYLAFLEILPPGYYTETGLDQLAVAPVGSGPYRLSSFSPPGKLTLEANPDYWQGAPVLPVLVFEAVPVLEERLAALADGQAALVTDLLPMPEDQWDVPGGRLEAVESTQRLFIGIQPQEETPLANKLVRQALNYGVNVEPIVADLLAGYGQRYGSWVNPPSNNTMLSPWPYDPEMAQKLLAQAGYRSGFTTTLRAPSGMYHQDTTIAEAVAQQLGQIGVTVEVEVVEAPVYVRQLLQGEIPPLFLLGLNSRADGLEDAQNLLTTFAFNPSDWHNDSFEEVLERAASTFNQNARARLLDEAQMIAYDEAPWIWLWRPYHFYGVHQDLNWTPRRDGLVNLYQPVGAPAQDAD